jgi:hypothetical protein
MMRIYLRKMKGKMIIKVDYGDVEKKEDDDVEEDT